MLPQVTLAGLVHSAAGAVHAVVAMLCIAVGLIQFLRNQKADLLDDMTRNDRKVSGDLEDAIKAALDAYNKTRA